MMAMMMTAQKSGNRRVGETEFVVALTNVDVKKKIFNLQRPIILHLLFLQPHFRKVLNIL